MQDAQGAAGAIPLLERALSFEESLRARTEGLAWSVWGIVLALVMLMYSALGDAPGGPPWWVTALWIPWVALGAAVTWALWRTAALSFARPEPSPANAWVTLGWIAAIVAGLSVFSWARVPDPSSLPVVAVGFAWILAGATNLFRASARGRRSILLIGATLVVSGIAMAFLLPPTEGDDLLRFALDVFRAGLVAGVAVLVGLRQAARG